MFFSIFILIFCPFLIALFTQVTFFSFFFLLIEIPFSSLRFSFSSIKILLVRSSSFPTLFLSLTSFSSLSLSPPFARKHFLFSFFITSHSHSAPYHPLLSSLVPPSFLSLPFLQYTHRFHFHPFFSLLPLPQSISLLLPIIPSWAPFYLYLSPISSFFSTNIIFTSHSFLPYPFWLLSSLLNSHLPHSFTFLLFLNTVSFSLLPHSFLSPPTTPLSLPAPIFPPELFLDPSFPTLLAPSPGTAPRCRPLWCMGRGAPGRVACRLLLLPLPADASSYKGTW